MGEGDIYYAVSDFGLVFSSDLRTLMQECPSQWPIDQGAVAQLLRFGYIPTPATVYQGVFKLSRGAVCEFGIDNILTGAGQPAAERPYWDHRATIERLIQGRPPSSTMSHAVERVENALHAGISSLSPGGICLLSGGVDSSLVAATLQRHRSAPIDTLTVGFSNSTHDESTYGRAVAKHLGANNECLMVGAADVLGLVSAMPRVFSEPYADSSALPTIAAARHMDGRWPAVLTGDGGDELFFGHSAYVKALRNHNLVRRLPSAARRWADRRHQRDPEQARLGGISAILAEARCSSLAETYRSRVSRWRSPASALTAADERTSVFDRHNHHPQGIQPGELLLYLDQAGELADGLMTKSDRAFGAFGTAVGNPFLSDAVVELAWQLPMNHKVEGGVTKSVLKHALSRHLPKELVHRSKKGFGSPISDWLRGPLREWAEGHLSKRMLEHRGVFNPERVLGMWSRFLDGDRKLHTHLWPVLMFLAWDEEWNGGSMRGW